ncbi:MAG: DUF86 domain-containing protein [Comamonadaceae bacterium]|nr:MAG: DUF86 domain-containing protein [Comamonadaceae bacterium]
MNKALRVPDYLKHILTAIERIDRYTENIDEPGFLNSELVQDAVIRNIEIIGEAANNIQQVDAAFAAAHAEIPWQVMYAMRNRLSHGYDKVDFEMVWKTISNDLPDLYKRVKAASI